MNKNQRMWVKIGICGVVAIGVIATIIALVSKTSDEEQVPQNTQIVFNTVAPTIRPTVRPTAVPTKKPVTPRVTPTLAPIVTPTPTMQIVTVAPPTPTVTPPSLQIGFTGSNEVRALQKRLKELGWYKGSVDGDFGPATQAAVKAFQKANGLKVDGKAGTKTLEKLRSSKAVSKKDATAKTTSSSGKWTAKVTAKPTTKPTATPNLSKDYYLETGSSGKKVRTLQSRLIELGYLGGKVTGKYDAATKAAVLAFQKAYKELWDDGVAGPKTLKLLYSNSARKSSSVASSTGETLKSGSTGSSVRSLQKRLKELGYFSSSIDGEYGDLTENAVKLFQEQNGLKVDGKAGSETLDKLYSNTAEKFKDKK